jgi:ABC-2 type transport system permease protein
VKVVLLGFYATAMKIAAAKQFQYRASNYLFLSAMTLEGTIYLLLWQAVATASGGSVAGWTVDQLAAYYFVWTLVRQLTIARTPAEIESRIHRGQFVGMLLRPLHPIHHDLAEFAGWKVVMVVLWTPIGLGYWLVFRPEIHVSPTGALAFAVAACGAFLIRSLYFWLLGLSTAWTVRATALFDLVLMFELLFSGRLLPMSMLPLWARDVAALLPFRWVFAFPIEVLLGRLPEDQLVRGLVFQFCWIGALTAGTAIVWRYAVRRCAEVGN